MGVGQPASAVLATEAGSVLTLTTFPHLQEAETRGKKLYLYTGPQPQARANAAVLVGAEALHCSAWWQSSSHCRSRSSVSTRRTNETVI